MISKQAEGQAVTCHDCRLLCVVVGSVSPHTSLSRSSLSLSLSLLGSLFLVAWIDHREGREREHRPGRSVEQKKKRSEAGEGGMNEGGSCCLISCPHGSFLFALFYPLPLSLPLLLSLPAVLWPDMLQQQRSLFAWLIRHRSCSPVAI